MDLERAYQRRNSKAWSKSFRSSRCPQKPNWETLRCRPRLKILTSSGRFVSNAGCNVEMADGTNAATSLPVALANLPPHFANVLTESFSSLHAPDDPPPDLSGIFLERVNIPPSDAATYTIGVAHKFLEHRSRRHSGQAKALVDPLLARLGPLGAKTETCTSFEDLLSERGFSRSDFKKALADLQQIPDLLDLLDMLIAALKAEGMPLANLMGIKAAAASIYRARVMGTITDEAEAIDGACDVFLVGKLVDLSDVLPLMTDGLAELTIAFPSQNPSNLRAHLALKVVSICADQI